MEAARIRKFIVNRVLVLAIALIVIAILARVFENRFIFFPPRYPQGWTSPDVYKLPLEDVWMTAQDGVRINGWFLPNPASPKALLWFHGNAENIGMCLEQMKALSHLGVNVLEIDYRGYGKSEGSPNEAGVYLDGEAAYQYLIQARHFQPANIFIYGHSLGGAIATEMAFRHPCAGLIVESSFTSARDMAHHVLKIPLMEYAVKNLFDSIDKIPQVHAPVMIIHGTSDKLIPFSMGQKLFDAAHQPKTFMPVQGAGHDDPFVVGGKAYWDRWREFVIGDVKGKTTGDSG
jgi:fermentation-respiration switch protein FrsA (DUF1100 family)